MKYGPPLDKSTSEYYRRRAINFMGIAPGDDYQWFWHDMDVPPTLSGFTGTATATGSIDSQPNGLSGGIVELKANAAGDAYKLATLTPIISAIRTTPWYVVTKFKLSAAPNQWGAVMLSDEPDSNTTGVGVFTGLDASNFVFQFDGDHGGSHVDIAAIDTNYNVFEWNTTGTSAVSIRMNEGTPVSATLTGSTNANSRSLVAQVYDTAAGRSLFLDFIGCMYKR